MNINILFENLQKPSFYINEQSQKIKFEIKVCLILFLFSKNGQNSFWSVQYKGAIIF